jgi:hypothetical protein
LVWKQEALKIMAPFEMGFLQDLFLPWWTRLVTG